jgi:hypothetical protein
MPTWQRSMASRQSELNEQVKRNKGRFPEDFMFQLASVEKDEVVANCDHLKNLKFSRTRPYAFTEHGAIMAANIPQQRSPPYAFTEMGF